MPRTCPEAGASCVAVSTGSLPQLLPSCGHSVRTPPCVVPQSWHAPCQMQARMTPADLQGPVQQGYGPTGGPASAHWQEPHLGGILSLDDCPATFSLLTPDTSAAQAPLHIVWDDLMTQGMVPFREPQHWVSPAAMLRLPLPVSCTHTKP